MNNWILLAVVAGLASSLFNYIDRYVLRTNGDSTSFAWWFEVIRIIIFLLVLPFDYFLIVIPKSVLLLLGLGFVEFISVYTFMKMHKFSEISVSSIISRLRIVWVPILAFIFLGEKLKLLEYLGIATVFFGLSFVVSPAKTKKDEGVKFAFISSFVTAALSVLVKIASEFASAPIIILAMSTPSLFLFPIFAKSWRQRVKAFYQKDIVGVGMAAFASAIALFFLVWALNIGPAGKVVGIHNAMLFTAVIAGIVFLNERENLLRKLLGTAVVLLGVFLLV